MIKKSLLTLMLTAMVSMLFAQSLQFEFEGRVYENNEIVICDATPNDWGEMAMDMSLHNLTSETIPVIVEKEHVQIVEGTENSFCWGLCFGPDVFVSRPAKELAGGEVSALGDLSFHYQVDPTYSGDPTNYLAGTTVVKYYAYPENNPDDKVCLVVWFAYNAVNVAEVEYTVGQAYPNPATSKVSFNINYPGTLEATIYNLLGQEVKSTAFNGTTNDKVTFSVDDLQAGIYFCTFTANGTPWKTEKFIVKK